MGLKQHLLRQMAFSRATFGPGRRTNGVLDHIAKELDEVARSGGHSSEWVDLVILSLDGLTRSLLFNSGGQWRPGGCGGYVLPDDPVEAEQERGAHLAELAGAIGRQGNRARVEKFPRTAEQDKLDEWIGNDWQATHWTQTLPARAALERKPE